MDYGIAPFGEVWSGGVFNVPAALADKYIRFASEYQLKALLLILSNNGKNSSEQIAKKLGLTAADVQELMEFWIAEGVVTASGNSPEQPIHTAEQQNYAPNQPVYAPKAEPEAPVAVKKEVKKVLLTAPTLQPKDIVAAARENPEIGELLNEAQIVLGRTISHSESEMVVNMVNFYGMRSEIVLMILEYCRSLKEKDRSRNIGTAYILKLAQNWMEEGIDTIADAEEKLKSLEKSDRVWHEISAMAGIMHKKPTVKQREMVLGWSNAFSMDMIAIAIDRMKENTDSPKLSYVDKILKSWKEKGISTPAQVAEESEQFAKSKEKAAGSNKKTGEISRKPTYDIEKIIKDAMNNTDIKY